jgi:hypothetical protein
VLPERQRVFEQMLRSNAAVLPRLDMLRVVAAVRHDVLRYGSGLRGSHHMLCIWTGLRQHLLVSPGFRV